ncbi:hypothetical protein R6Q57_027749 [Mikania cordata]
MNPRSNNPNPEFNPFSYDPKSLRNFLVQLQQNLNIQHFQEHSPNFQPPPNFQPGFAPDSQHRFESDFVSPSQPEEIEVVPETQDTQKRKKGKKNKQLTGTGSSSGPIAPKQWTHDREIMKKMKQKLLDKYRRSTGQSELKIPSASAPRSNSGSHRSKSRSMTNQAFGSTDS